MPFNEDLEVFVLIGPSSRETQVYKYSKLSKQAKTYANSIKHKQSLASTDSRIPLTALVG